ncbi:MAG TPA: hypothetical protein P5136_02655 [Methanofastidiosum sp.]|nr:hypothetical protein [Methanofastidiosum sp.]
MEGMDVYEKNCNKTTYQKIKKEASSALFIYVISTIISKIITYGVIAPILMLITLIGKIFTMLVNKLIPKTKEEISLERFKQREKRKLIQAAKSEKEKYDEQFEEWKRQKLLTDQRGS